MVSSSVGTGNWGEDKMKRIINIEKLMSRLRMQECEKKYKPYDKLKEEIGDKFDECMYKSNIEFLTKIDRAIEFIENNWIKYEYAKLYKGKDDELEISIEDIYELLKILKGDD